MKTCAFITNIQNKVIIGALKDSQFTENEKGKDEQV